MLIYHSSFNHLLTEVYLSPFYLKAFMNKVSMNICIQLFVNIKNLFIWDKCPQSETSRLYGGCMVSFLRNCRTVF